MTKERLEELIKQGATVVVAVYNGKSHYKLMTGDCVKGDCALLGCVHVNLHHIYETDEEADWALKVHCERWEFFEPPMWEDIENCYGFYFFNNEDRYSFEVKKNSYIEFCCNSLENIFVANGVSATKENYIKACEMVRDLFRK